MSNEIALYSKLQNPIEAIERLGQIFAKSNMFGCDRVEQGQVLAMICLAEHKSPVAITRDYHIIDGKLSKKALASLADFRARGGKHKWIKTGDEGGEAVLELTFEGSTITSKFTLDQAKAQGLIRPKSNWEKTPGNMLRARCASNGVAMLCPEIYAGDEDTEQPAPVAAPLLPPTVTATTTSERPPNVIDVSATVTTTLPTNEAKPETVVTEPQAQAPGSISPVAPAATVPEKKFGVSDVRTDPATGKLSVETVMAIDALIPADCKVAADKWLKAKNWITSSLEDLNIERARRLIEKPDKFLEHVRGGK